jgi:hypothetical protein|tara:strand:+ start:30345 stop:30869 length:525 start_codon:yes stop_codon:yes gene_type:complete
MDVGLVNLMESFYGGEILYHGSPDLKLELRDIETGFWCATEPNSPIIDYYGGRGKLYKFSYNPKGLVVDMTEYDTDVDLNIEEGHVEEFLADLLSEDPTVGLYDKYFTKMYDEGELYSRSNDLGDEVYTTSEVLNYMIREYFIPNVRYSAIRIMESSYETISVFRLNELQMENF